MLSFNDTRDFLLLSYDMKLIKDDEFGLFFDTYMQLVHQRLDLPHDFFPPFDKSQLNEYECSVQFFSVSQNRTEYCLLFFGCQPSLIN